MDKRQKNKNRFNKIGFIVLFIVFVALLFMMGEAKLYKAYQIITSVMIGFIAIFVVGFTLILIKNKKFTLVSLLFIIAQFGFIYMDLFLINRRIVYLLYTINFILSIIYLIIGIIIKIKLKKDIYALDSFWLLSVTSLSNFISSIKLTKLVHLINESFFVPILVSGGVISFVSIIIYVIFKKDRSDKKNYFGAMAGLFFMVLAASIFIPYLSFNNINYMMDRSIGEKKIYKIVEMRTRSSSKTTSRIITVIIDGKEEDFNVPSYVYYQYNVSDYIEFEIHEGCLGYEYYEYIIND